MEDILEMLREGLEALKTAYLEADGIPAIAEPLAEAALKFGLVSTILETAVAGAAEAQEVARGLADSAGS
jgi:hypothetical protein